MATPTSLDPGPLFDAMQLGNSLGTLYTSTGVITQIQGIWLVNDSTGSETVTLYAVPSGGAAGDDNIIVKDLPIGPKAYHRIDVNGAVYLESGGTLEGLASSASVVTIHAGGVKIS